MFARCRHSDFRILVPRPARQGRYGQDRFGRGEGGARATRPKERDDGGNLRAKAARPKGDTDQVNGPPGAFFLRPVSAPINASYITAGARK